MTKQLTPLRRKDQATGYQAAVRDIAAYLKKHKGFGAGWYGADVEHKFGSLDNPQAFVD